MDQDTKLAELAKLADANASELERMIGAIRELGDLPVAFSREALVDELGFDAAAGATCSSNPMIGALRA
jgi:hypothetical protein